MQAQSSLSTSLLSRQEMMLRMVTSTQNGYKNGYNANLLVCQILPKLL